MEDLCLTNTSLFTSIGAIGDICSGRGECINGLCVCDPLWNGNTDWFPLNACQNPIILDKLMWGLASLMLLILWLKGLKKLMHQRVQFLKRKSSAKKRRYGIYPAVALLELVIIPGLTATFIARTVLSEGFGIDNNLNSIPLSIVYAVLFSIYMMVLAYIEHSLFQHLILGTSELGEGVLCEKITRIDKYVKYTGSILYCFANLGVNIAGLMIPRGPTAGRILLIISKNCATSLFFLSYFVSDGYVLKKLRSSLTEGKIQNDKFHQILLKIEKKCESSRKKVVLMFLLNLIFSVVPQLYAFNYCMTAFLLAISSSSNHVLMTLSSGNGSSHQQSDQQQQQSGVSKDRQQSNKIGRAAVVENSTTESNQPKSVLVTSNAEN